MAKMDFLSVRSMLDFLKEERELVAIDKEIDPVYEISGIIKALDNGPLLLFENIKGYPGVRNIANICARDTAAARIFGVEDASQIKFKCVEGIRNPISPEVVEDAPCQEVVIKEKLNIPGTLPIIKHTEEDAGHILGGSIRCVGGRLFRNGFDIGFNRMHFRGPDWSSMSINPATHFESTVMEFRGEKIPLTINICPPPAVMLVAGGGSIHTIIPFGADEIAIAGGVQGFPVEICKAKTVDAYSIAHSEWVIEGYIDTKEKVWESPECEKAGDNFAPFFPEYTGYMGTARQTYKFQATALTHRRDRPIFHTPLAHGYEMINLCSFLRDACFYEVADRLCPGLTVDVNMLDAFRGGLGVVYQIKKRRRRDDGYQKNILSAALAAMPGAKMVIVVDEDIDIYSAEDVLWAITTRANLNTGIIIGGGARGSENVPMEAKKTETGSWMGGMGIDATIPLSFKGKGRFKIGKYPVDRVDLARWLTEDEIKAIQSSQRDYAKILAKRGQ